MKFDTVKIMECVDWKRITADTVTFNVDGEKLRQTIYDEVHIEIEDNDSYITLQSGNHDLVDITPNSVFNKQDCMYLAKDIQQILNNRIKAKLEL